jgi:hypothetical protein
MRDISIIMMFFLLVPSARAVDVWALQGQAIGPPIDECRSYGWRGALLLHNARPAEAIVSFLDVSNGRPFVGIARELHIGPGKTIAAPSNWVPSPVSPSQVSTLWVIHLDVPEGVTVESRIEITTESCVGPPLGSPDRGKLSFPVYGVLQPAGTPKVHLGTDLASTSARDNIAVYNAGSATAQARLEVRRACDEQVIDARDLSVPPNSVIQVTGLNTATGCTPDTATVAPYTTYATVTLDQPSLSWVSTLANDKQVNVVYGVNSSSP